MVSSEMAEMRGEEEKLCVGMGVKKCGRFARCSRTQCKHAGVVVIDRAQCIEDSFCGLNLCQVGEGWGYSEDEVRDIYGW